MQKTQDEAQLKKELHEQFLLSKRYLDNVHERMNQQEELYRSFIDKNNYPHNARVFDPRVFRVIETIVPRMVANEPTGSFYPREGGDVATAQILNALIRYDWYRAGMFEKMVRFTKSMLIFGTAFGRVYWDYKEMEKTRMVPEEVNGQHIWNPQNKEKINVTVCDYPNFEVLNIYDCFPDPNATCKEDMRWFIYRRFRTLDELKAENETRGSTYYQNLDKLEAMITEDGEQKKGSKPDFMQYREHRRMMLSTDELLGEDQSNPDLTILRRYERDRWVDYIPGYDLIIRDVENQYFHNELPIVYGVDYIYPGELYGMGEIEPVDRIQRAINAVLNQRLDNVQLTLRNMWIVDKNAGVDMHTLYSAPGNIITANDINGVKSVEIPDVTGSTFVQTMNYLTSALQNGTGITDYTIGMDNQSNVANKTATGTRLIQQEANAQFKLKIQLFNKMVIEDVANQFKDLRIQYTTEEQLLRIVGRNEVQYLADNTDLQKVDEYGEEITPGDLDAQSKLQVSKDKSFAFLKLLPNDIQPYVVGDYDFIASPSSEQLTDPIAMQENFFIALDRVKDPAWTEGLAAEGKKVNFGYLTEKIFEKLNIGLEANDVLQDAQPPIDTMGMQPDMGQMQGQMQGMPQMQMPEEMMQEVPQEMGETYGF